MRTNWELSGKIEKSLPSSSYLNPKNLWILSNRSLCYPRVVGGNHRTSSNLSRYRDSKLIWNQKKLEIMMTEQSCIPDRQTRTQSIARWREACRKLDWVTLNFDQLIAMIEADLHHQNLEQLHNQNQSDRWLGRVILGGYLFQLKDNALIEKLDRKLKFQTR